MESASRNHSPPSPGAFFESFDGWAQLLNAKAGPPTDGTTADPGEGPAEQTPPHAWEAVEALPWRPGRRAAMALLHVVDDGRDSGETIRLRDDTLVIGRVVGGARIPHDGFLDRRHARLDRLPGGGWLLSDTGSRDGTWVRVMTAKLRPGTHFQIGGTRLVFQRGDDGTAAFGQTGAPTTTSLPCPPPPFLIGRAGALAASTDPGLPILHLDDPFVSPIHAEVIAGRSAWRIVNRGLNGIWVRIEGPVRLDAVAQFQCGDQRFVLEPLTADS